jgi:hypothetical protein
MPAAVKIPGPEEDKDYHRTIDYQRAGKITPGGSITPAHSITRFDAVAYSDTPCRGDDQNPPRSPVEVAPVQVLPGIALPPLSKHQRSAPAL